MNRNASKMLTINVQIIKAKKMFYQFVNKSISSSCSLNSKHMQNVFILHSYNEFNRVQHNYKMREERGDELLKENKRFLRHILVNNN